MRGDSDNDLGIGDAVAAARRYSRRLMTAAASGGTDLSLTELSRRTGLSRSAVLRRLRSGDISGATRRDDGQWVIPDSAVDEVLSSKTSGGADSVADTAVEASSATATEVEVIELDDEAAEVDTDDADEVIEVDVVEAPSVDTATATDPGTAAETEGDTVTVLAPPVVDVRADLMDVRPATLDPELERGLRAELAEFRRKAAVAEALAAERQSTIDTLREALDTIRRILPETDEELAAAAAAPVTTAPATPAVDSAAEVVPEPVALFEASEGDDDPDRGGEWVWQTSATADEPRGLLRFLRRR